MFEAPGLCFLHKKQCLKPKNNVIGVRTLFAVSGRVLSGVVWTSPGAVVSPITLPEGGDGERLTSCRRRDSLAVKLSQANEIA